MKVLLSALAAVMLLGLAPKAHAQANGVNCAALSGTPLMCIKNTSSFPIVGVTANPNMAYHPTQWIPVPGGSIMPGGTTIVRFSTGWGSACQQYVFVRTADGRIHPFAADVCHSTSLVVSGW